MIQQKWQPIELDLIRQLRPTCMVREISSILKHLGYNRTPTAIKKRAIQEGLYFKSLGIPVLVDIDQDIQDIIFAELETRLVVPDLHPTPPVLKTPKKDIQNAEDLLSELTHLRHQLFHTRSPKKYSAEPRTPYDMAGILVISDWHIGRVVNNKIYKRSYNLEIAKSRFADMFKQFGDLTEKHSFKEVLIVIAGDITDGLNIFPGQEELIEFSPIYQVKHGTRLLIEGISYLEQRFPYLEITILTAPGNHGRVGSSQITNYDNLLYLTLETLYLKLDSNVTMVINNFGTEHNIINFLGWELLIRHKAPVQADTPAARDRFAGWYAKYGWDGLIYGHFHHWGILNWNHLPIFRNGSGIGADQLADDMGVDDAPTQLAIVCSQNKLPESVVPLFLSDSQRK